MTPPRQPSPAEEAVRRWVAPQIGAMRLVGLFSTPAELLVPVAWWLSGRRGAPMAPTAVATANAALAAAAVPLVRRRPQTRVRRSVAVPLLAWTFLAPALAGRSRRLVLLPGRSPMWAWALQTVAALGVGLVQGLAIVAVGRRAAAAARRSDADG